MTSKKSCGARELEEYNEQEVARVAWVFLRSNTTCALRFGENMQEMSYVISPSGELVISAMVAMLQPCDTIMYVPDYGDDCMEMHVSLEQFSEEGSEGSLADRWQVYHGEPPDMQWAKVNIDAARFHEMFIDGDYLQQSNLLEDDEAILCKALNQTYIEKVRVLCFAKTKVEVEEPVVVGVDSLGLDVRATFGIVRVPFDTPVQSSDDVLSMFT